MVLLNGKHIPTYNRIELLGQLGVSQFRNAIHPKIPNLRNL